MRRTACTPLPRPGMRPAGRCETPAATRYAWTTPLRPPRHSHRRSGSIRDADAAADTAVGPVGATTYARRPLDHDVGLRPPRLGPGTSTMPRLRCPGRGRLLDRRDILCAITNTQGAKPARPRMRSCRRFRPNTHRSTDRPGPYLPPGINSSAPVPEHPRKPPLSSATRYARDLLCVDNSHLSCANICFATRYAWTALQLRIGLPNPGVSSRAPRCGAATVGTWKTNVPPRSRKLPGAWTAPTPRGTVNDQRS